MTNIIFLLLASYFIGSLNGAQLLHHVLRRKFPAHITRIGTKNAGMQNVWMNIGKKSGLAVFAIDFFKSYLMIALGKTMGFEGTMLLVSGALVILGHNWPIFFHFRGGRGFASLIGVFYAFDARIAFIASVFSLPIGIILRLAGITPFIFLLVGSLSLYSHAYILIAVVLFAKRIYAEWKPIMESKNKITVLKNLLLYDRATSKPPSLKKLFS